MVDDPWCAVGARRLAVRAGSRREAWGADAGGRSLGLEQTHGSDACSVPEAAELGPNHIRRDPTPSCRRIKAAIGRGEHFGRVTEYHRHSFNPVGYNLGMLHDIR